MQGLPITPAPPTPLQKFNLSIQISIYGDVVLLYISFRILSISIYVKLQGVD